LQLPDRELLGASGAASPDILEDGVSGAAASPEHSALWRGVLDQCLLQPLLAAAGFTACLATVAGNVAKGTAKAGRHERSLQHHVVLVLTCGLVDSAVAFIKLCDIGQGARAVRSHNGRAVQSPSDLHLRALSCPGSPSARLPPVARGHGHAQRAQETQRWGMVVVVTEGVAMATAVIQDPSHALTRMLMHEEHGIQSDASNAILAVQALAGSWHARR